MSLNIRVDNAAGFAAALLPPRSSIRAVMESHPGFLGAWDAADYSGSGPWLPRYGSGAQILPAAAGSMPVLATRDGRPVLSFGATSKAFVNDASGVSLPLSNMVLGMRCYFSDATANFQKIADLGAPELYFRSSIANPVWQFAGLGAAGSLPIAAPVIGWHRFVMQKSGASAALMKADGGNPTAFGSDGSALAGNFLTIGDAANASGAAQEVARVILCNTGGLTAEQRAAFAAWLA